MAGEGSRLRGPNELFLKPFVPVRGRGPLEYRTLWTALLHAGIKKLVDFGSAMKKRAA